MTIHKKILFSTVSFACAIVMWQAMKNSCPPREQHLVAVTDVVEHAVDRIFEERIKIPEESRQLAEHLSATVIPKAVSRLTEQRVDFTDYGIFSLGEITGENGDYVPISIGLFGKVFTVSEDNAYDYLKGYISEQDIEQIIKNLNESNHGEN